MKTNNTRVPVPILYWYWWYNVKARGTSKGKGGGSQHRAPSAHHRKPRSGIVAIEESATTLPADRCAGLPLPRPP